MLNQPSSSSPPPPPPPPLQKMSTTIATLPPPFFQDLSPLKSPLLSPVILPAPLSFPCSQPIPQTPRALRTLSSESTLATSPHDLCCKTKASMACNNLELARSSGIPSPLIALPHTKLYCTDQSSVQYETSPSKRRRTILGERNDNQAASLPVTTFDGHTNGNAVIRCVKALTPQTFGSIIRGKEDRIQQCAHLDIEATGSRNDARKLGSLPLKRKRPPKLDIPLGDSDGTTRVLQPGMAAKEQPMEEINVEGSHYGVACKKGRREVMEDTHTVSTNLQGNSKQAFFGVFDGHGGRTAAAYAADNLLENINEAFAGLQGRKDGIEKAVSAAYLTTDAGFLLKHVGSGASSVTALLRDGYAVVANAGDCRAVLSRAGKAEALTRDHRAGREDERKRIESSGGYVDCFHGVWRVQGVLAVSRGFGDANLKEWISAEPDVKKLELTPDCEFLILASDGLWDKVSDQEAVDCARHQLLPTIVVDDSSSKRFGSVCKKLVEMAVKRGGQDDICVVLVDLPHFCTTN